jgi:hypothetical protein
MALFDNAVKGLNGSWVPRVLIGVGVARVAPIVVPALAVGVRSLVKTAMQGGMVMSGNCRLGGPPISGAADTLLPRAQESAHRRNAHLATLV